MKNYSINKTPSQVELELADRFKKKLEKVRSFLRPNWLSSRVFPMEV